MATPKKKPTKQARTLRQSAEASAKPKKRRLKAPARSIAKPFKSVSQAVRKGKTGKVARFIVPKYFRNSWRELREVTWPDRKQTIKLTFAVIAFATVFGLLIALIDFLLDKVFRQLFL